MKKPIILICLFLVSCAPMKTVNVDREIQKAEQRKKDKENLPIIVLFCLAVYFGGKFMTDDFK